MSENDNIIDNTPEEDSENDKLVSEIIEFYSDLPSDEYDNESDDISSDENGAEDNAAPHDIPYGKSEADDDLHDASYGLNRRGRYILTCVITAAVCAAVMMGSYTLAVHLPGNDAETEEYADKLRAEEDYAKLEDELDTLQNDIELQKASIEEKKSRSDNVGSYANTKAELRGQISKKAEELKSINGSISDKTEKIEAIDAQIAAKSGTAISLAPGRYTVGKDIAAGRYTIMGNGSFAAATSSGSSKYNTTLGSTPVDVELSAGDRLKLDCTVKFTPSS